MYQVTVPGKLIISGEHAVVYGNPALAAAIDRYVQVRLAMLEEPIIQFAFAEYTQPLVSLTFPEFWQAIEKLQQRYQQFLQGECPVTEITTQLYDLPLYALGLFIQHTKTHLTQGMRITISGDLPMGYGLGSSAAVVVGILRIASLAFAQPCTLDEMQQLAVQVENLQHGRSSGLDPSICLHGGVVLYSKQEVLTRKFKPWSMYLINTGQPLSSTGECVAWVKQHSHITTMLEQFRTVTLACDQALQSQSFTDLQQAIQTNHRLLCELDVVPARIQSCIAELEKYQNAAKICGAGSIIGENAGYLLVLGEQLETIETIAHEFDFAVERVQLGVNI
jgi:mevalonate kinase